MNDEILNNCVEKVHDRGIVFRTHLFHFESLYIKRFDIRVIKNWFLIVLKMYKAFVEDRRLELAHRNRDKHVRGSMLFDHAFSQHPALAEGLVR